MNLRSSQFYDHFRCALAGVLSHGWRQPFVMRGKFVWACRAPEMRLSQQHHDNDNARRLV